MKPTKLDYYWPALVYDAVAVKYPHVQLLDALEQTIHPHTVAMGPKFTSMREAYTRWILEGRCAGLLTEQEHVDLQAYAPPA
jgi:hypothetical protein